jgi:hypothetical protein
MGMPSCHIFLVKYSEYINLKLCSKEGYRNRAVHPVFGPRDEK